ncbi:MAG: AAA family ATPase [Lachnospiraceae bacterium]|jgi:uncharacterized protein YhaN|nr:AAA family ATPase [Lachnospiraceae bacterium]MCI1302173.1 AAA family ATPase [Lachnospiraceae bacterium]MCI1331033.1 AAA family ATPase [Lachnospiraceae bacterium]MCI1381344.1 AAA family ATPase [Lachnospiraceae bacterium]
MIIRHCHIDHFGTLENYDRDFKDGFNSILRENGTGKSTLAAFISVMLYGFQGEGIRKDKELKSERLRYRPWGSSGTYGGTLTFTYGDHTYRIERSFGAKPINDVLRIYNADTNQITQKFGEVPGEKIFDLDIDSFRNTVFLTQQGFATEVTNNIRAKIGDVSDETADLGNYDEVQKKLKKQTDALTPDRKNGEISKLQAEAAQLEVTANERNMLEDEIGQYNASLEKLTAQKGDVRNQIAKNDAAVRKISALSDLKAKKVQYDHCVQAVAESKNKVKLLRKELPTPVPEESEISQKIEEAKNLTLYRKSAENFSLSSQEASDYQRLSSEFADGVPKEEILNQYLQEAGQIRKSEERHFSLKLSPDEQRRFDRERALFANGVPDEAEVNELLEDWSQRNQLLQDVKMQKEHASTVHMFMQQQKMKEAEDRKREEKEKAEREQEQKRKAGKAKTFSIVSIVLGLFLMLLGMKNWLFFIPGSILLIFGIIKLASFSKMQKGMVSENPSKPKADAEAASYLKYEQEYDECLKNVEKSEGLIKSIERKAQTFLGKFQMHVPDTRVENTLNEILHDITDYHSLAERVEEQKRYFASESSGIEKQEITDFVKQYLPQTDENDVEGDLKQIQYDRGLYQKLQTQVQKYEKEKRREQDLCIILENYLRSLNQPTDNPENTLMALRDKVRELQAAENTLTESVNNCNAFEEEHKDELKKIAEMQTALNGQSLEELQKRSGDLNEKLESIQNQIRDIEQFKEQKSEKLEEAEKAAEDAAADREKLNRLEHTYRILVLTQKYLQVAKENFSKRYMTQIKSAFLKYYRMICPDEQQIYELDANLNLQVRERGGLHDIRLLSEGYQDLVSLCRRMSMIEAMYKQEKPFLILDDPFVNLDDKKLQGAKEFLSQISTKYQVIYFTCQQSRA